MCGLIIGCNQGEGDRKVRERVGRQEQGEAAQVEFVDAEGAAEVLEHLAAMSGHVESRGEVVEHVVDEPRGEIEEELPLERLEDPFDAHAVFEDALQHQDPGPCCRTWPWGEHPRVWCERSWSSRSGPGTRRK